MLYVTVESLDVVVVRVKQEGGVVTGGVVAQAGAPLERKPASYTSLVKSVDLIAGPGDEAEMQPGCDRKTINNVETA